MDPVNTTAIALALAMDAFAVALGSSTVLGRPTARHYFRLAFHFGLFQALMPVLGWLAGTVVADHVGRWGPWIALGLLAAVGLNMIRQAVFDGDERPRADPTRGLSLVVLSVATSIDALAVGVSFALLDAGIWIACLVIGLVAAALTCLGLFLGSRLGRRYGRVTEVVGGLLLVAIGIRIVVENVVAT